MAVTEYVLPVPIAPMSLLVATPLASVTEANVTALGPVAVTVAPGTGLLLASSTVTLRVVLWSILSALVYEPPPAITARSGGEA